MKHLLTLLLLAGCAKTGSTDPGAAYAEIAETGVAAFDEFFAEVAAIHDTLEDIELDVASSKADVAESLGLASDTDVEAALAELLEQAEDNLEVELDGWKPLVSTSAEVPVEVEDALVALNRGMDDVEEALAETEGLSERAAALVEQVSALPGKVDKQLLEDNGLAVTDLPAVTKATKDNLGATRATVDRLAAIRDELVGYPRLVIDSLAGEGAAPSEEPAAEVTDEEVSEEEVSEEEATEEEATEAPDEERELRDDGSGLPKTTITKPERRK